jgi:hypothetical protein
MCTYVHKNVCMYLSYRGLMPNAYTTLPRGGGGEGVQTFHFTRVNQLLKRGVGVGDGRK